MSEIIKLPIEEEVKSAYLDYAMSVIVGRAIPDVRDGLKPVQRRILYTMYKEGMLPNRPFKKSARTVGMVIAKYHPHGDTAVYDALVRLAQDFVMRYPLIEGQGNFGSIDGDPPAAMRYCLTGDTLVHTDKGLIKIKDIVPNSKLNSDNPIDIKVLSLNNKINKADIFFNSGVHKTIKIETYEGFEVEGSYNHPVLTFAVDFNGKPIYRWKTLNQIKEEDYILVNRNISLDTGKDYITKEEAILLGSLLSDDTINLNKSEEKRNIDVKNYYNYNFDGNINVKSKVKKYRIGNKKLVDITNLDNKEIPEVVLKSSRNIQRYFLQALFEEKGDIDKEEIYYVSLSKKFLKQLQILLLNFSIISYISKYKKDYKLTIKGYKNLKLFKDKIGFLNEKQEKLNNLLSLLNRDFEYIPFIESYLKRKYKSLTNLSLDSYERLIENYPLLLNILDNEDKKFISELITNNYYFAKVKNVEETGENVVYSVRVNSKCHSFTANGIINHNTEARLTKLAMEMLADIEKDTVDMRENFDATDFEPEVLPSKFPNLICNGTSGIAVGLSTNIPPHNFTEVAEALKYLADFPDASIDQILQFIKGPDFPTGGILLTTEEELKKIYSEGKGSIKLKGKARIERLQGNRHRIVIYEIPYQVNKVDLIKKIAELVRKGKEKNISDLRDETDRTGIRIIVELKREADPEKVLKKLYKHTQLQKSIPINLTILVDKQPKTLDLKSILLEFIKHRVEVITRRTKYELKQAEDRKHIVEGLIKALENADNVIDIIRSSTSVSEAKESLINKYELSNIQSQAILDMKLSRFTGLESDKLYKEKEELDKKIERYREILSSDEEKLKIFKDELDELLNKYGDERKTIVVEDKKDNLTYEENFILAVLSNGKVINKRYLNEDEKIEVYKKVVNKLTSEDKPNEILISLQEVNSTTPITFITNNGYAYWSLAVDLPKGEVKLNLDDKIIVGTAYKGEGDEDRIFILTKNGIVKRMSYEDIFYKSQKHKIIPLNEGDEVVSAFSDDHPSLLGVYTKNGDLLIFERNQVRITGDKAKGVEAIDLDENDEVKGGFLLNSEDFILIITEKGYTKLVKKEEFFTKEGKPKKRGQKGLKATKLTDNDKLSVAIPVKEGDTLFISTKIGKILKFVVDTKVIPITKRQNIGERLFKFDNDRVIKGIKPKVKI